MRLPLSCCIQFLLSCFLLFQFPFTMTMLPSCGLLHQFSLIFFFYSHFRSFWCQATKSRMHQKCQSVKAPIRQLDFFGTDRYSQSVSKSIYARVFSALLDGGVAAGRWLSNSTVLQWDWPVCIIYCYGLPMILRRFCSSTVGKTIPDDSPSWLVWATILCYAAQDVLPLAKVVGSAHLGWKVDGPHPGRKVSTALDRSSRPVSVALLQLRPHNPAALHFYFSLSPQPTIPPSCSFRVSVSPSGLLLSSF